jgi:plastocyanin
MKKILIIILSFLSVLNLKSETHTILVWDGYMQFMPSTINIELGDTIHFLPLDFPLMMHTITSTNIPSGASSFDVIWQAPADTFFQYIPQVAGTYDYVCTPHISTGMVGSFVVSNSTNLNEISSYKNLVKIIDVFGKKNITTRNILFFYIYDDGTVEKKIILE